MPAGRVHKATERFRKVSHRSVARLSQIRPASKSAAWHLTDRNSI
jgi:hypothetical protein